MPKTKEKTAYFCSECGYESSKWMGQCPACHSWNTFQEIKIGPQEGRGSGRKSILAGQNKPVPITQVTSRQEERFSTGSGELDRVLGGGIVQGSLVLVGGDPGIGKSTILLQMMRHLAGQGKKVLYVSGEESMQQVRMRADRIGEFSDNMRLFCETGLEAVEAAIEKEKPYVAVIDSIQTISDDEVSGGTGSVSQIRSATASFMRLAKSTGVAVFLVGHVTKEGSVAGPKMLEHMVDTVLYFEGDPHTSYRILRAVKNRFGSTNEIGVFEMRQDGLSEVPNPSEYLLDGRPVGESGSVTGCILEGTRPMLIEIQALVCRTAFGFPRRTAVGMDLNRLNLLLAVLEKRVGMKFSACDAYINITGGMRSSEPALDAAVAAALISSYQDIAISEKAVCFGEIGLSGEIRGVSMANARVQEARRLGFTQCILPYSNLSGIEKKDGIRLSGMRSIRELADFFERNPS